MKKVPTSKDSRWSMGLMTAMVLFGVSSTYFVLKEEPAVAVNTSASEASAEAESIALASAPEINFQNLPPQLKLNQNITDKKGQKQDLHRVSSKESGTNKAPVKEPVKEPTNTKTEKAKELAPSKSMKKAVSVETVEKVSPKPGKEIPDEEPPKNAANRELPPAFKRTTTAQVRVIDDKPAPGGERSTAPTADDSEKATPLRNHDESLAIKAESLVKKPFLPKLLMATENRVWVQVDEQKTLIFDKGETVPHFGVFQENAGKSVKFSSGSVPIPQQH